jgi:hypothetical protein
MSERSRRGLPGSREKDFERLLMAEMDAGHVDFPKGLVVPEERSALARLGLAARALFASPALAYALLAAVVAVFAVRRPGVASPAPAPAAPPVAAPAAQPAPSGGTATVVELGGGATRASGRGPAVAPQGAHGFVVLRFLAPIRSDPSLVYRAQVAGSAGVVLDLPRLAGGDALGRFDLVVPRTLLPPGGYVLTVAGPEGETHRFPFEIRRPEESAPGR